MNNKSNLFAIMNFYIFLSVSPNGVTLKEYRNSNDVTYCRDWSFIR